MQSVNKLKLATVLVLSLHVRIVYTSTKLVTDFSILYLDASVMLKLRVFCPFVGSYIPFLTTGWVTMALRSLSQDRKVQSSSCSHTQRPL